MNDQIISPCHLSDRKIFSFEEEVAPLFDKDDNEEIANNNDLSLACEPDEFLQLSKKNTGNVVEIEEVKLSNSPQNSNHLSASFKGKGVKNTIEIDQLDNSQESSSDSLQRRQDLLEESVVTSSAYSAMVDLNMMVDDILTAKRHPSIKAEKKRRFKMTEEQSGILETEY